MLHTRVLSLLSAATLFAMLPVQPASAGRGTVDGGVLLTLSGYCSPNSAGTADCAPHSLPTAITIGGVTYNSFWVNSNGTASFGSIESHLKSQNSDPPLSPSYTSLSEFGSTPVFSPNFSDGPGYFNFVGGGDYDGSFVSDTTLTADGFSVSWYTCGGTLSCGPHTSDLLAGATFSQSDYDAFKGLSFTIAQLSTLGPGVGTGEEQFNSGLAFLLANPQSIYTMTLEILAGGGFQVDYIYNDPATGEDHPSGFSFPGTLVENPGPLTNRTYVFNAAGALINGVPEPSTWLSLLLGFGVAGFALRRRRRLQVPA
jgi:hypothetical protein